MKSKIKLEKQTTHLQAEDISRRVVAVVTKLQQSLQLATAWDEASNKVVFESVGGITKGVDGTLQIGQGILVLEINLPLMLQVQADSIEKQVESMFDEALK